MARKSMSSLYLLKEGDKDGRLLRDRLIDDATQLYWILKVRMASKELPEGNGMIVMVRATLQIRLSGRSIGAGPGGQDLIYVLLAASRCGRATHGHSTFIPGADQKNGWRTRPSSVAMRSTTSRAFPERYGACDELM